MYLITLYRFVFETKTSLSTTWHFLLETFKYINEFIVSFIWNIL